MESITSFTEEQEKPGYHFLDRNNIIIKKEAKLASSKIIFKGTGNILFLEDGVQLKNSTISFLGNNSIIYLSSNKYEYRISTAVHNNCAVYIGKNCYMSSPVKILSTEGQSIFIGNDCLIALNVVLRNSDAHAVYDIETTQRINYPKSVFIGDHVWLGMESVILKGSQIGSGTIIASRSLVPNRIVPSNSMLAGSPAKIVKKGVFFEHQSTHTWTDTEICVHSTNNNSKFIYLKDDMTINIDEFIKKIQSCSTPQEKLNIYIYIYLVITIKIVFISVIQKPTKATHSDPLS